ncbi:MAG: hypothetical protein JG768_1395 [Fusobacteriales bacterium]|jgi:hypothetical protein|nr:hypothetical protein [Fusobacteriales bacterium]
MLDKIIKDYLDEINEIEINIIKKELNDEILNKKELEILKNIGIKRVEKIKKELLITKKELLKNIDTLITFVSFASNFSDREESIIEKNIRVFYKTKKIILFYTFASKKYFENIKNYYKNIKIIGYEITEPSEIYDILDNIILKEKINIKNTIIDITNGFKSSSIFFYKFLNKYNIPIINWKEYQLESKNKKFIRIPFTIEALIFDKIDLKNFNLYEIYDESIEHFDIKTLINCTKVLEKEEKDFLINLEKLLNYSSFKDTYTFFNNLDNFINWIENNKKYINKFKKLYILFKFLNNPEREKDEDVKILNYFIENYKTIDLTSYYNLEKLKIGVFLAEEKDIIFYALKYIFFEKNINEINFMKDFFRQMMNYDELMNSYYQEIINNENNNIDYIEETITTDSLLNLKEGYFNILNYILEEMNSGLFLIEHITDLFTLNDIKINYNNYIAINEEKLIISKKDLEIKLNNSKNTNIFTNNAFSRGIRALIESENNKLSAIEILKFICPNLEDEFYNYISLEVEEYYNDTIIFPNDFYFEKKETWNRAIQRFENKILNFNNELKKYIKDDFIIIDKINFTRGGKYLKEELKKYMYYINPTLLT